MFGCIICTETFLSSESSGKHAVALNCGHIFHCSCLKTWLEKSKTCPICRFSVTVQDQFLRLHLQSVSQSNSAFLNDTVGSQPDELKEKEELIELRKTVANYKKIFANVLNCTGEIKKNISLVENEVSKEVSGPKDEIIDLSETADVEAMPGVEAPVFRAPQNPNSRIVTQVTIPRNLRLRPFTTTASASSLVPNRAANTRPGPRLINRTTASRVTPTNSSRVSLPQSSRGVINTSRVHHVERGAAAAAPSRKAATNAHPARKN
ncbi:CLUMA_CG008941, isoform A [Clunio marinus]|uniref:CLUMA_CG008941, isoform A n=1 Tax=Clunio marinus TaxID=568069 RepID=A0A1J1I5B4_9DIPT|nr:CLUMA_CG008941, isoform A [Clunio marinus]